MSKVKISIIIPVYNVEKYIKQCLYSVITQTFKDIEIIVVNDGSTDNSLKILQEFAQKDKRIIIVDKKNEGASSARNIGIEKSQGKYIYFIDSDDWIENDAIEILYKNCSEEDIVYSNLCQYNENTKKIKQEKIKFFTNKGEGKYFLINGEGVGPCNKLYKLSFLKENNLKFLENIIYEDLEFNFRCFFLSQKVKFVNNVGYNYRMARAGSVMTDFKIEKSIFSINKIIKSFSDFYDEANLDEFKKFRLFLEIKKLEIWKAKLLNKFILKEEYKEIEKEIKILFNKEKFNEIENKILQIEIGGLIDYSNVIGINIFDKFYWENKIFTFRILRRLIKRKIMWKVKENKVNKNENVEF